MNRFLQRLADPRPILLDGATGTELQHRGIDTSTSIWSALALLESPKLVEQVHRDYLDAGAEVIITNTFRTHRRNLEQVGLGDEAARLTTLAVAIAQAAVRASGKPAYVAGGIAPLEDSYTMVPLPREVYLREHGEIARTLAAAGVDLLLLETMKDIAETEAAAEAAKATGLPFGVSFICKLDGRLFSGESIADAARAIEPHGPAFIGINCTAAPYLHHALHELRAATTLPLSAYANPSETEDYINWDPTAAEQPEGYAEFARQWLADGAKLIGGCCGTTPEHIAHLRELIAQE
ncbi:MAG: homocysteine S-methyltransferase family protein [Anaerolineales bacterium]|jgi:homocysteine S-methyltransferase|nr:homocysteine S-methyltransferase family protein [Anaerolineales bacterium]MBX3005852.1 homocysteine S-methyltransferase family protein [Anaerolineales bacterium]MCW5887081.1 homocysteine S-methyltransferase family protein [Anaerolineales bacterium]